MLILKELQIQLKIYEKSTPFFTPTNSPKSRNFEKKFDFQKIEVSLAKMRKTQFDFQL